MQKTSKAIKYLNAWQAVQQATIQKQASQLKAFRDQEAKKRVAIDPNTLFANVEDIKRAQDEADELAECIKTRQPEIEAQKASEATIQATMQNYMFEWQAY